MENNDFIAITSLICEPSRAKILWSLLDGRAYTASELALASDLSASSASNHLSKLLNGKIVKVDVLGRHRYFSFANAEVAYVVESLASLADTSPSKLNQTPKTGVRYCRTCYDHLAGYVGVALTNAMVQKGYLIPTDKMYSVTEAGWNWFSKLDISKATFTKSRRPLTRQCLDWSERRPHLSGHLGGVFMERILEMDWFRRVDGSRELLITSKGRKAVHELLGIDINQKK